MDDLVSAMLDKSAIGELLTRHLAAVDRGDYAVAASCFAEGAICVSEGTYELVGREAIYRYISSGDGMRERGLHSFRVKTHFMGNLSIDVQGPEAESELHVTSYAVNGSPSDMRIYVRGLRYLDRHERLDGKWLIAERYHTIDWAYDVPASFSKESHSRARVRPPNGAIPT